MTTWARKAARHARGKSRDGSPRLARLVENFEQQLPKLLATIEANSDER